MNEEQVFVGREKPDGFIPNIEVVGCYLCSFGKYLFIKKSKEREQGETWGIPGGRVEKEELLVNAVIRELLEETQIKINPQHVKQVETLYVKIPSFNYILHLFTYQCSYRPEVILSSEHQDFKWVTLSEAKKLSLLLGGLESLSFFESTCHIS